MAPALFGELAADHHVIRALVDRLEHQTDDWLEVADGAQQPARPPPFDRDGSGDRPLAQHGDHQQQVRLLLSAMRGIDQLTDRLRLPAHDPLLLGNILVALRSLEHEHERLETELLAAELDRAANEAVPV